MIPKEMREIFIEVMQEISRLVLPMSQRTESPSRRKQLYNQLRRIDATLHKELRGLYVAMDGPTRRRYEIAVTKARVSLQKFDPQFLNWSDKLVGEELHTATMRMQIQRMQRDFTQVFDNASRNVKRIVSGNNMTPEMSKRVNKALLKAQFDGEGTEGLAQKVFRELNGTGQFQKDVADMVTGKVIRIKGRNYNLAKYSEMVARVRMNELDISARTNTYAEAGVDLVQIGQSPTPNSTCPGVKLEGTIWSVSGNDPKYQPLSECPNGGPPFQPRCHHDLLPYIPGHAIEKTKTYQDTEEMKAWKNRISSGGKPVEPAEVIYLREKALEDGKS